ncbi:16 kDa calcium-binding protein-like [Tubulanus polymorphus]|uniref:16 kDa calcium-binding protein-like n=1 Tax=Tubulanus polymorphus TaxID=672921 RepID=UPI003DA2D3F1
MVASHEDMLKEVVEKTKKYDVADLEASIRKYDATFAKIDSDKDGFLCKDDLVKAAKELGELVDESTVEGVYKKFDVNGSDTITLQEFLEVAVFNVVARFWRETMFEGVDDPTKGMTMADIDFLDISIDDALAKDIAEADKDKNGFVDFEEFKVYLWADVKGVFGKIQWFKDFLYIL